MTTSPAAVLWDMDGTIIDTEPFWMQAETEMVESFGGEWSHEKALTLVGQGLFHSARVLQSHGVELGEQEIIDTLTTSVQERLSQGELPWRPGARELLEELHSHGIPTALVTMSIRRMAVSVVRAIDFDAFTHVVGGDDVEHGKPHPAAYLRAAELLGVSAVDCVAIEDSAPGVAAAVASGAATIAIPLYSHVPDHSSYVRWESLAGRSLADLRGVLASRGSL